ncbi:hypothetical protein POVCU2_0019010 [Plasmodium ovale curtisi]|uniref:Uncharacterized protein n=1 Tax=Plasmodium ovale curtisi TaxID=864141 RepID=A0A1A8VRM3_PLAOA|nr:hypothetical protein POVCU2_0019010 [Plasmodium ovale curtisi]SBS89962.1 hypothetical protein POVCU1_017330 [Plasmodium ovale curtisi]
MCYNSIVGTVELIPFLCSFRSLRFLLRGDGICNHVRNNSASVMLHTIAGDDGVRLFFEREAQPCLFILPTVAHANGVKLHLREKYKFKWEYAYSLTSVDDTFFLPPRDRCAHESELLSA